MEYGIYIFFLDSLQMIYIEILDASSPQLLLVTNYNNILVPTFENKKNENTKYILFKGANIYTIQLYN